MNPPSHNGSPGLAMYLELEDTARELAADGNEDLVASTRQLMDVVWRQRLTPEEQAYLRKRKETA